MEVVSFHHSYFGMRWIYVPSDFEIKHSRYGLRTIFLLFNCKISAHPSIIMSWFSQSYDKGNWNFNCFSNWHFGCFSREPFFYFSLGVCYMWMHKKSNHLYYIYVTIIFQKSYKYLPLCPSCLTCKISHTNFVLISCFLPLKWFAHVNKLKIYLNSAQTLLIWNLLVKKKKIIIIIKTHLKYRLNLDMTSLIKSLEGGVNSPCLHPRFWLKK